MTLDRAQQMNKVKFTENSANTFSKREFFSNLWKSIVVLFLILYLNSNSVYACKHIPVFKYLARIVIADANNKKSNVIEQKVEHMLAVINGIAEAERFQYANRLSQGMNYLELPHQSGMGKNRISEIGVVSDSAHGMISISIPRKTAIPVKFQNFHYFLKPFNAPGTMKYNLPHKECVTIKLYNVHGDIRAGSHGIQWTTSYMVSSVHIYRMVAGSFSATKSRFTGNSAI
jgi:hypothetical protein